MRALAAPLSGRERGEERRRDKRTGATETVEEGKDQLDGRRTNRVNRGGKQSAPSYLFPGVVLPVAAIVDAVRAGQYADSSPR